MALICVLVIIGLIIQTVATNPIVCTTSCEEGQYCHGTECLPCKEGYYQSSPVHAKTHCLPWTTKPPDAHWVIARHGTSESDVEWRCENGYEISEFSTQEYECRKIVTTTGIPLSLTSTMDPATSYEQFIPVIIGVSVGSGLLIISLAVLIIWLYRTRRRLRFRSQKNNQLNHEKVDTNENETERKANQPDPTQRGKPDTSMGDTRDFERSILPSGIDFRYFHSIVKELGVDSYTFINHLEDPSGDFDAKSAIDFRKLEFPKPEQYFTEACLDWARANPDIDHKEYVRNALLSSNFSPDIVCKKYANRPTQDNEAFSGVSMGALRDSHPASTFDFDKTNNDIASADERSSLLTPEKSERLQGNAAMKSISHDNTNPKLVAPDNSTVVGKDQKVGLKLYSTPSYIPSSKALSTTFLYKLFSRLVQLLGPDDSLKLLYRLPNKNKIFNVGNTLKFKQMSMMGPDNSLIETLMEWQKKNLDIDNLQECLFPLLAEIERNDVKEDEDVIDLLSQCL